MQKIIITILPIVVIFLTIALFFLVLSPPDRTGLSYSDWAWLAVFSLALPFAVFAPMMLARSRGTPRRPPSSADIKFFLALVVILCPLAFFAVWTYGPFGSFVILLVPLAFILRSPRRGLRDTKGRNA